MLNKNHVYEKLLSFLSILILESIFKINRLSLEMT